MVYPRALFYPFSEMIVDGLEVVGDPLQDKGLGEAEGLVVEEDEALSASCESPGVPMHFQVLLQDSRALSRRCPTVVVVVLSGVQFALSATRNTRVVVCVFVFSCCVVDNTCAVS